MKHMYITNNEKLAVELEKIGVEIIWIDLEKNGKYERQKHINSVKSNHSLKDIKKISPLLKKSELMVRVNPIYEGSKAEIEAAINYGADIIMLPMFKTKKEVQLLYEFVNKRCKVVLLLETKEAVENLNEILEIKEIENIHIGLNDLSLSYGYKFMFQCLSEGIVEYICNILKNKNIIYGFGGIANIGEGTLPAELILSEHFRLGSQQVILSRGFCKVNYEENSDKFLKIYKDNFDLLKIKEKEYKNLSEIELLKNKDQVKKIVEEIIKN